MKKTSHRKLRTSIFFLLLWMSYAPPMFAQAKTTISGWLRTGVEYEYNKRFRENFYRGKVQFNVKVDKNLEAQIDIRGESATHEMELREAFFTADLGKAVGLDFGQGKKRFGLEFQKSKENLLTNERTLIYQHLEPFGFVGRDVNLRYYRKAKSDGRRNGISLSLGYSEDHNVTVVGHWTRLNTIGSFAVGASSLVQIDKIAGGSQIVWALGAELLRDMEKHHVEIEAVAGQDPFRSEFEKSFGDGKNVYFFGGKILYGHYFKKSRLEPVLVYSLLVPDVDAFDVNTVEVLAGLNYYAVAALRIGLNSDLLLATSTKNQGERTYAGSKVILQVQLVW
ncbi:MAG: hypothetical protein ONB46_07135 [candidate division KSB1 bacterium]|nr:hypothetical protein [candidate division KSB1 bacterium]MDZ7368292.1 hypothetical protein [candidate division KSB1 bacterium]MDZ7406128.1 hypothetical protein [candidate division KSB1 bacterium]